MFNFEFPIFKIKKLKSNVNTEKLKIEKLKNCNIDTNIFHGIFKVGKDKLKSSCIYSESPIFIDDSFQEREDVSKNKGIPCFDVSEIPFLFDFIFVPPSN